MSRIFPTERSGGAPRTFRSPHVWPDFVPATDTGSDHEIEAGIFEGHNCIIEALRRMIPPGDDDEIFWQLSDDLGILRSDVAPHQYPFCVRLDEVIDAVDVICIHAGHSQRINHAFARARTKAVHLIAVDMKERTLVERN